jgi:hypothetical protein
LYRGINEFKKGDQLIINIIKDENGNLVADFHSVLNWWKCFFMQVLNIHRVHNFRQKYRHMSEPLQPEPSLVELDIAIGKLKSYKTPDTEHSPSELNEVGGETLCSEIYELICCI